MKLKKRTLGILFAMVVLLLMFSWWQNNAIEITEYEYYNPKVPESFHDYTIVQISDLHNKDFQGRLVNKVVRIGPDLIVITGDLIDRRNTDLETAIKMVEQLVEIAPVFYVSGNHEQLSDKYAVLKEELEERKVTVLDNGYQVLKEEKETIWLLGLADPAINQREGNYLWEDSSYYTKTQLQELLGEPGMEESFRILLSHRPELFNIYREMELDLVFSGHAHGGQIRLPFVGGLVAPNQGLFPKYTAGIYKEGSTSMVVSRGLGNSIIPQRVFNRPEIVVVALHSS